MNEVKIEELVGEITSWLASKSGEAQLNQAIQDVRQMSFDLQKARELKPEILHEPVTL